MEYQKNVVTRFCYMKNVAEKNVNNVNNRRKEVTPTNVKG